MEIVDLTTEHADDIVTWRYPEPYGCYDLTGMEPQHFTDLTNGFFALVDSERLIGYRCYGAEGQVPGFAYDDRALDIGGGLRPELTGQGLGHEAISTALDFARARFAPSQFRVTVAEFNVRALKVVDALGFSAVDKFESPANERPYVVLTRTA
ncbi:acetyltransferase (GNAT) family protein [Mumia flava]|uniref:Acetyltransferase (GNAT) family protein n=1 Tax=Mumia flava TaxID=1348852 RepID=A0A2M9B6Q9_9ACTN|nr:GNAT family protein [Mumia flava]PJJ53646.1 acetyltransferase (GNAT) family protein [Mumia flava]